MTFATSAKLLRAAAGLAALALSACPAGAQVASPPVKESQVAGVQVKESQPWQPPVPAAEGKPKAATSDLAAATAATTAAQRHDARALTGAVFSRPAAAARAVQKADAAKQPDLSAVDPKPEWTEEKAGVGIGGKGVQIKTPF